MFLDAHVNKASYFDDVYISKVTICTEAQVSETSPLAYGDGYIYQENADSSQKEVHLVLNKNSFNEKFTASGLSSNMFFVYVECSGTPSSDAPCRLDEMTTLGVTLDYGAIYNPAMNYTRELGESCKIPRNFIDFILNYEALKVAIETEHYVPAIERWKWLMNNASGKTTDHTNSKPCGCYG